MPTVKYHYMKNIRFLDGPDKYLPHKIFRDYLTLHHIIKTLKGFS